jgi:protein required for attachment to host cells
MKPKISKVFGDFADNPLMIGMLSNLLDQELTDAIVKELPKKIPHIFISSATQKNLVELKDVLWKALNKPI